MKLRNKSIKLILEYISDSIFEIIGNKINENINNLVMNGNVGGLDNNYRMKGPQNVDDILKELEEKENRLN